METTFVMIKPNAVEAGMIGRIIDRYETARLAVSAIKIKSLTVEDCKGFYAEHVDKPFFAGLAEFMSSGPTVLMALTGEDAVAVARALNGATNPENAEPGTIRHAFARTITKNVVHSSDSVESAAREVSYWFDDAELVPASVPDFRI